MTFILKSITLTMSDGCVEVLTGEEFIRGKYGERGMAFVANIISALDCDNGRYGELWVNELHLRQL